MKSVDDHLADCLGAVEALPALDVALLEANDCLLAEDVVSPISLPPFDNSAMDGYAVRGNEVRGASPGRPVRLRVLEAVPAGRFPTHPVVP
ncbi:MAG TPA: molybdopterin molybdenumtransferase MoeA, partial [Streptosporangiaceae bacterium]|nr:molybdopterin molybdenumtransferase MoeA [Streptosporangiaceae bacterium]